MVSTRDEWAQVAQLTVRPPLPVVEALRRMRQTDGVIMAPYVDHALRRCLVADGLATPAEMVSPDGMWPHPQRSRWAHVDHPQHKGVHVSVACVITPTAYRAESRAFDAVGTGETAEAARVDLLRQVVALLGVEG